LCVDFCHGFFKLFICTMILLRSIARYWLRSLPLACVWLGMWANVLAQTAPALPDPDEVVLQASIYKNGQAQMRKTAAQIAASPPQDFTPFDANRTYISGSGQSVWLKLQVTSGQSLPAAWLIDISKPYVDIVTAHTLAPNGAWTRQVAGDWIAHRQWPNPSLTPQFNVPAWDSGQGDIYLEIQNSVPLNFKVSLISEIAAKSQAQNTFLVAGLFLGPMIFLSLACFFMAAVYRMAAYAWYAAYVAASVLFGAAYIGLGGYTLWPLANDWSEVSIVITIMTQMMFQLQFARTMFITAADRQWIRYGIASLLVIDSLVILLYWVSNPGTPRLIIYTAYYLLSIIAVLTLVLRAVRRGGAVAWLWVLANTPLIVASALATIEGLGYAAVPWLPYNAVLYALAFEMVILWVALHLSARDIHSKVVKKNTLAGTDPLTGFITPQVFPTTLDQLWDASRAPGKDMAVAYILVTHYAPHKPAPLALRGQSAQRAAARAVRLLRTVAREQDAVAHVDKDVFALLMPGLSLGDDVTDRLARLVALAAMTDREATRNDPLMRFHIAASSARSFDGPSHRLHAALRSRLNQTDWGQRAIRYVRKRSASSLPSGNTPNETLSQLWERAVEDEAYQSTRADLKPN
jgi:GGDEF domain-containing protein